MTKRIAAVSAMLAFTACVLQGIVADNSIATTLSRAMIAMCGTFGVGLVIGAMASAMMAEHHRQKQAAMDTASATLENSGIKAQAVADKRK